MRPNFLVIDKVKELKVKKLKMDESGVQLTLLGESRPVDQLFEVVEDCFFTNCCLTAAVC